MSTGSHFALLPVGVYDLLPPQAQQEATCVEQLMHQFASFGYDRVTPPLVEFDSPLLDRNNPDLSHSFQLLDPLSNRLIAIRSDITLQVARIAASRLIHASRPLRLCYAGQILRMRGSQLRPERQFGQVGCELIGSPSVHADAEIIFLAATALRAIGIHSISVDLCMPMLVSTICRIYHLTQQQEQDIRHALNRKDLVRLIEIGGKAVTLLSALMEISGTTRHTLERLAALELPPSVDSDRRHLIAIAQLIEKLCPDLTLTLDPVEGRGFSYQAGISFTFFARDVRGELGRGGRYYVTSGDQDADRETATGVTLYTDTVLRAIPPMTNPSRVFIPFGNDMQIAQTLRQQGWITMAGLEPVTNDYKEASRLGCSHLFDGQTIRTLND